MLRSTFLGYKTATSALRTNQHTMDVVGQNISNINTKGYTRQRHDISSLSFNASNMKYSTSGTIIGQGVKSLGVSQYRDPFLDYRYRIEAAKAGSEQVQYEALRDLEYIFDEITVVGLDAQFSNLLEQLHALTSSPSDPVLEGVVRTSAEMLTQMFNDYSRQIDTVREQQFTYFKNGIDETNQLLDKIARLNKQIKESNISGNAALELNDERNLLIDELSNYLDIEVFYDELDIGGNKTIDLLSITLKESGIKIVDDTSYVEIGLADNLTYKDDVSIILKKSIDATEEGQDITSLIDKGQLEGYIKFLNGKGDFALSGAEDFERAKGVQYYQKMLDELANRFATEMNKVNQKLNEDGELEDRPLFSARSANPDEIISAGNIKISDEWASSATSYITNTRLPSIGNDTSGATDNILKMISLFQPGDGSLTYSTSDGKQLFTGTFQEFLSYTTTRLNLQVNEVETSYNMFTDTMYQIEYERSSMSSVDLNEEGVNLLQYSKSYNAAARLMTTLDEMLDTLINRMG